MRFSPHAGSKPGYTHITDVARDRPLRIARALAWSQATGRPVPPHLRFRSPARPAEARDIRWYLQRYEQPLTAAQVSRLRHKLGRNVARQAGFDPSVPSNPRRPSSPAQIRRARKDAAQKARHAARVIAAASMAATGDWASPAATPLADIAAIGHQPSGLS